MSFSAGPAGSCCCVALATFTPADSCAFPASGHLEHGESVCQAAARETFEETGIMLGPETLRHVLSIHQRNRGTSDTRVGFAFTPSAWTGEPVNAEPHKHSELVWAAPTALPADTAEYTAAVVTAAERGLAFTLNGW
jgi:8-oxo-dGTP diphosphatase